MSSFSFVVLGIRDFRLLLFTRVFGMMALQAQAVVAGWQIYSITKDPFMLGLAGLAEAIPALSCALFAGHVVDISRPHRVFISSIFVLAVGTMFLLMVGGGMMELSNNIVLICLYAGIFISGVARSFIMPSSFSIMPKTVERKQIPAAMAWLNSGFQLAAVSGSALAGIIYGGYGAGIAWLMPVTCMTLALLMLCGMSSGIKNYRSGEKRESAIVSIREGWHFILNNQLLLTVMALDMFAVLFGGAVAMLPAFADQVLQTGSEGLGLMRAAPACGAIVTAVFIALRPLQKINAAWLLWVVAGFGICMVGFGLSRVFWLSILFLVLSGAFDSVSMIIRSTLMQLLTPDAMRGRVSSVNSMFIISSNEIGAFESGLAARLMGLVPSVVFGGVCTLIVAGAAAFISPKLRRTVVDAS